MRGCQGGLQRQAACANRPNCRHTPCLRPGGPHAHLLQHARHEAGHRHGPEGRPAALALLLEQRHALQRRRQRRLLRLPAAGQPPLDQKRGRLLLLLRTKLHRKRIAQPKLLLRCRCIWAAPPICRLCHRAQPRRSQ